MTIKYMYMLGADEFDCVFQYLHIPVDSIILKAVEDELGIAPTVPSWSKWDNYDEYLEYQKQIRDKVNGEPLCWEFHYWLNSARNIN